MAKITLDEVRALLQDTVPSADWRTVNADDSLEEAGLDSLDKATLIMKVEEATGLSVQDEDYEDMDTISSLITYVEAAE